MSFIASGIGLTGWLGIAGTAASVGSSIYSATQSNKAAKGGVEQQKTILSGLKYEPIDIAALKADATATAIENATQSLALERSLSPNVAGVREELARQVNADLKLAGELSPDVVNRVTTAGRVIGAKSGIGEGGTVPLTASMLGLSSVDLMNQRRAQADRLLGQNDLPTTGLDPGQLAALEVADNAANNQFNVAKAGGDASLINSEATARAAQIGGQTGMISSLSNLAFGAPSTMSGGLYGVYSAAQKNRNAKQAVIDAGV